MEESTTTTADALIMSERVRQLLTEEPQFLPQYVSLISYCNRQLAKIERARWCDTTQFPLPDTRPKKTSQLEATLAQVAEASAARP